MERKNVVKDKSFAFAVRIVKLSHFLKEERKEYVLNKQILRSGTAVGALIRESEFAESKTDFKHKLSIAQKELNETIYWLELLKATQYITEEQFQSISQDAVEIMKLLTSIINAVKKNIKEEQ